MNTGPLVECRGLCLAYGSRVILADVGLAIGAGEFWVLIGPNGQGKSTLVHALLGLHPPSAGRLVLDPSLAGGRAIGFVPQRLPQLPALPCMVREFVRLGLVNLPGSQRDSELRVGEAMEQVKLGHLQARDIRRLSGGERQRAMVARALVRRPRLLLLDEPTTGLDIDAEHDLVRCLEALHAEGITMALVTHDLHLARRLATHAALITKGQVTSGVAADILTDERLSSVFRWEPSR